MPAWARLRLVKTPKTPAELLGRALAHHRAERTEEAETFFRKVIFRNPKHVQALFGLGGLLFESGRFAEASLYLERLVAVCPDEPRYLTNLDLCQLRAGLRARLSASPFGDVPRFARNLEALFRTAWRRHCANGSIPWAG
jgi:tetratricopeptide (TPR) repeat protein